MHFRWPIGEGALVIKVILTCYLNSTIMLLVLQNCSRLTITRKAEELSRHEKGTAIIWEGRRPKEIMWWLLGSRKNLAYYQSIFFLEKGLRKWHTLHLPQVTRVECSSCYSDLECETVLWPWKLESSCCSCCIIKTVVFLVGFFVYCWNCVKFYIRC